MIQERQRSLNLFDFRAGKVGDFYLLDEFSDASEYGGETDMRMGLMEDPDNSGQQICKQMLLIFSVVRIQGKLIKERNSLLPIDYLFFGFKSLSLF